VKQSWAPQLVAAQGLADRPHASGAEAVRHLGAVQAQLHDLALWGIARRCRPGLTFDELSAEFDSGGFLRTHLLRPTWHHVRPDDIGWLLALTGPRIESLLRNQNRTIGLSEGRLNEGLEIIATLVADGPRTRDEVRDALTAAGHDPGEGALGTQRLAHQLMAAELHGIVCSGPRRGKQHTYAALSDRVPSPPPVPSRDECLARLARTYARGHGPFRDVDLAWWATLTLTDARRAIQFAELRPWREGLVAADEPAAAEVPAVLLLPNFDELISYARDDADFDGLRDSALGKVDLGRFMRASGLVFGHGRLVGWWRRKLSISRVEVSVHLAPGTKVERPMLHREAEEFAAFLRRRLVLSIEA
jgi:hypothetical protein